MSRSRGNFRNPAEAGVFAKLPDFRQSQSGIHFPGAMILHSASICYRIVSVGSVLSMVHWLGSQGGLFGLLNLLDPTCKSTEWRPPESKLTSARRAQFKFTNDEGCLATCQATGFGVLFLLTSCAGEHRLLTEFTGWAHKT